MKHNPALKITFWYLLLGLSWILYGGNALSQLLDISNENLQLFEVVKGSAYVCITALLLYLLVKSNHKKTIEQLQNMHAQHMAALKEANRKFELATSVTDEVIWEWYVPEKIIWFSNHFSKYYPEPLPADHKLPENVLMELVHPMDFHAFQKTLQQAINEKAVHWMHEFRIVLHNGETRNVFGKGVFIYDAKGGCVKMVGSMQDITPIRTLRRDMDESNNRLNILLNKTLEGVWIIDENDTTTYVNNSIATMLGYKPMEMIGRPYFDFMSSEWAERARKLLAEKISGKSNQHEFVYRNRNGKEIFTIAVCTPLFENNLYRGSLKLITDISNLKEKEALLRKSEEQYKLLFDVNPQPMWVYDAENYRFCR
jgi:PAS domain S-box-containing protein